MTFRRLLLLLLASVVLVAPCAGQRMSDARTGVSHTTYETSVPFSPPTASRKRLAAGALIGAVVLGSWLGIGIARGCEHDCRDATIVVLAIGVPIGALLGFVFADVTAR